MFKKHFWPNFSKFQAIWNNIDFFYFWPNFLCGGGRRGRCYGVFSQEIVYLCYSNAVYRISISYYVWNMSKSVCGCSGFVFFPFVPPPPWTSLIYNFFSQWCSLDNVLKILKTACSPSWPMLGAQTQWIAAENTAGPFISPSSVFRLQLGAHVANRHLQSLATNHKLTAM